MRKHFSVCPAPAVIAAALLLLTACGPSSSSEVITGGVDSGSPVMSDAAAQAPEQSASAPATLSRAAIASPEALGAVTASGSSADGYAGALATNASLGVVDPSGAMLVRSGRASLEVKRVDDAVSKVRTTAAQFGGFVANATVRAGRDEQRAATMEVRVPTAQFDALVSALGGIGRVESVSAAAQDVGDEYVDLGARVANARRLEARLSEMVATRTSKLSDLLALEQELTRVREQIERYESRLKWLERRTALSSLELSLHEELPLIDRQPGPGPIAVAFADAWMRAVAVLAWCIASLGLIIPVLVLGAAGVWLARRLRRVAPAGGVPDA